MITLAIGLFAIAGILMLLLPIQMLYILNQR